MAPNISFSFLAVSVVTFLWLFTTSTFLHQTHSHKHVPHIHTTQSYIPPHPTVRTLYPFRDSSHIQSDREQVIRTTCHHTKYNHLLKTYSGLFTVNNVLTRSESDWIVSEAEKHASKHRGWHTERHEFSTTTHLPLTEIESLSYFSFNLIYGEIIPLFNEKYKLVTTILGAKEMFIVKYEPVEGQKNRLEAYFEGGEFSFLIPLNDNWQENPDKTDSNGNVDADFVQKLYESKVGQMLMCPSQQCHVEEPVTSGTRYVVVGQLGLGSYYACDDLEDRVDMEQRRLKSLRELQQAAAAAAVASNAQRGGEENVSSNNNNDEDDVADDDVDDDDI